MELILRVRKTPTNQSALVIALVDGRNEVRHVFAQGANFILYKPVSEVRANHSLRVAHGLMRRERRRHQRIALHTQARNSYGNVEDAAATLIDLIEQGIALQSERRLPPQGIQFNLPGQVEAVRVSGDVIWQDSSGRVGIRFADVPHSSRRLLSEWLRSRGDVAGGGEARRRASGSKRTAGGIGPACDFGRRPAWPLAARLPAQRGCGTAWAAACPSAVR